MSTVIWRGSGQFAPFSIRPDVSSKCTPSTCLRGVKLTQLFFYADGLMEPMVISLMPSVSLERVICWVSKHPLGVKTLPTASWIFLPRAAMKPFLPLDASTTSCSTMMSGLQLTRWQGGRSRLPTSSSRRCGCCGDTQGR